MAERKRLARRAVDTVGRVAGDYRANRDDLEPVIRFGIDVLALAAVILRSRQVPAAAECARGKCS